MARVCDACSAHIPMGISEGDIDIPDGVHDPVVIRSSVGSWGNSFDQWITHEASILSKTQCLALIGQVLRRRFKKLSVEKLRQDVMRIEDSMTTAYTLSEQVEKRGAQSWVDPLIENMGEWLLLQLGDMANLLEVLLK